MSDPDIPWYKEFFGEDYLHMYAPMLLPEHTAREVEGIINTLALLPDSSILDLCCGHGRHSIPLAQRGYQVTGQDLSEVFLQHARSDAEAQGVQIRWIHSDMRDIPFENEFDAVINIFTAFGYLETEDEDQKVLQQIHKALKPGGLFLLETLYREGLWKRFSPSSIEHYPDGLIVLEEREFEPLASHIHVQVTFLWPDGRRTTYHHRERFYTLTELAHMMEAVGLKIHGHYGGLHGGKLTLDSRRLVVVAQKP